MKILIFFVAVIWSQISVLAAGYQTNIPQENFIVAKVNNRAITNLELADRYRFVIKVSKISIKNSQDKELLESRIIDKMIDEELIRQEADDLKIEATKEEVDDAIELMALRQNKNTAKFKLFFLRKKLSFDNYLKQIESEILWSKIISQILKPRVKVTEVEVREFFEQQKYDISIKKFSISEILISKGGSFGNNAASLAKKLVDELRQGADFDNIVQQFSASFSSENAGKIGWVSRNDVSPKVYEVVLKLTKNSYSNPVLLADGYHIFKLLDIKTETEITDKDFNIARNAIFIKKLETITRGHLMDIRKKSFIEVDY